jgi:hypothetical protein
MSKLAMIFAMICALAVIAMMAGLGVILALAMAREDGARPMRSARRPGMLRRGSRDGRCFGGRLASDARDAAAAGFLPPTSG